MDYDRVGGSPISKPDVRLAIINAILADVATKGDIERLEARMDVGLRRGSER